MNYIEIIKDIRNTHNLSQESLAKILEVSQKTVSNWEAGNDKPKYDSILAIYKNFDITPNELLGIENIPSSILKSEFQTLYESLPIPLQAEVRGYMKHMLHELERETTKR